MNNEFLFYNAADDHSQAGTRKKSNCSPNNSSFLFGGVIKYYTIHTSGFIKRCSADNRTNPSAGNCSDKRAKAYTTFSAQV